MTQHMLSMPDRMARAPDGARSGCEGAGLNGMHGSAPDYAGLNGRRAASARGATICAD